MMYQNNLLFLSAAFATNPQFFINLTDPNPTDDVTHCSVIISCMQKQDTRNSDHCIGLKIFECNSNDQKLGSQFFKTHVSVSTQLLNVRGVKF